MIWHVSQETRLAILINAVFLLSAVGEFPVSFLQAKKTTRPASQSATNLLMVVLCNVHT
jgi:hypothetical protein